MIQCFRAQSVTDLLDEEVLRLLLTGASVEYGIPLALFASNGSEIARFDPTVKDSQWSAFCKDFRLDPTAEQARLACDRDPARATITSENDVQIHLCHVGLTHVSVPLSVCGAKVGVLLSGQLRRSADDGRFVDRLTRWTSHLGATRVRELGKTHADVPDTSASELSQVQEGLRRCAGFLQTALTRAWRRCREEREREFLVELTQALSASLAEPQALNASVEVLCGTLRDFLGTSDLAVVLYDRKGGRRLAFAAMGLEPAPPPAFVPPGSLENTTDRFVLHANDSDIVRWLVHSDAPEVVAAVHRFCHLDYPYALLFASADVARRLGEIQTVASETLWRDAARSWQGVFADIQYRTALRDGEQSLSAFVERAVHDLKHPLTGVRMSAEEALEVGAGRATEWVHRVLGFSNELDTRIHNLIRAAMHTDGGRLRRGGNQKVPVRPMIDEIIEQYRARIRTRKTGQRIDFHAHADPVVLGNPVELRTVFENLIDNAVKYCYPGKVVRGTLDADVSQMTFAIDNYGPGILPDEREKIWQRYYRGVHDSDRSGAVAGTGIGCYVVKQVVEAYGGKVWFHSYPSARSEHDPEEVSAGWAYVTRFHVVLPLGGS